MALLEIEECDLLLKNFNFMCNICGENISTNFADRFRIKVRVHSKICSESISNPVFPKFSQNDTLIGISVDDSKPIEWHIYQNKTNTDTSKILLFT